MENVVAAARSVDAAFRAYTRVAFEDTEQGKVAVVRVNHDEFLEQLSVLADLRSTLSALDEQS